MHRRRGTSLPLVGLVIFGLLAVAALAIDWGFIYFTRHQLQNFADAAALAGAQELPDAADARSQAVANYARNYGENRQIPPPSPQPVSCPPDDPDLQPPTVCYRVGDDLVQVTTPYQRTGDPSPNPNFINVKACRIVSLFFARVIGITQIRVCARATALGSRQMIARGLVVLDPSGRNALWLQGNASLRIIKGAIWVNSTASDALLAQGSPSISADQIGIVGGYRFEGNPSVTGTLLTGQSPMADPLANLPPPDPTGLPTFPGRTIGGTSVVTLDPGIYTGPIRVEGNARVILRPGIYILRGGLLVSGNGIVTGSLVLLYNESGRIEVQGNGRLELTAPSSGPYAGISVFQPATNSEPLWVSGNGGLGAVGALYLPRSTVHVEGNAVLRTHTIVPWRMEIIGNPQVIIAAVEPPAAAGQRVDIQLVE